MNEWIKLSNAVKYVGIEVHPSSRRRIYLKARPVADVRCQPLLPGSQSNYACRFYPEMFLHIKLIWCLWTLEARVHVYVTFCIVGYGSADGVRETYIMYA